VNTDNFAIHNTESQDAFDLLSKRFQSFGGGDAATVVLKSEAGFDDLEVEAAVAELDDLPGVVADSTVSPHDAPGSISESGTMARFNVNYLERGNPSPVRSAASGKRPRR
jgi:hypothetical protein